MKSDNLSWIALYVGIKNSFITPEDILKMYYERRLRTVDERFIIQLEVNRDSRTEFLSTLREIVRFIAEVDGLDITKELEKAEKVWHVILLKKIADSPLSLEEKLIRIENLWAELGYPREWEKFIYYMPNQDIKGSKRSVYQP